MITGIYGTGCNVFERMHNWELRGAYGKDLATFITD